MKRTLMLVVVLIVAATACRNKDQSLTADVEIPVSVEELKLKSIEEYVNTTGTAFPKVETELRKQESLYEKGGVTLKELKTAGINYENAKTTVINSKLQLQKTRIVATIDGVIVDLPYYTQGTEIASGVTIVKIMD